MKQPPAGFFSCSLTRRQILRLAWIATGLLLAASVILDLWRARLMEQYGPPPPAAAVARIDQEPISVQELLLFERLTLPLPLLDGGTGAVYLARVRRLENLIGRRLTERAAAQLKLDVNDSEVEGWRGALVNDPLVESFTEQPGIGQAGEDYWTEQVRGDLLRRKLCRSLKISSPEQFNTWLHSERLNHSIELYLDVLVRIEER